MVVLEFRILEKDGVAGFWRRVDLSHEGWKKVVLPLRWFRYGTGRVPRWDRIDRFQFWFRDEARLWIDTLTLQEGRTDCSAELSAEDLRDVAFPKAGPQEVKVRQTDQVLPR